MNRSHFKVTRMHGSDLSLVIEEGELETWRDLCDRICQAEGLLVLDAKAKVFFYRLDNFEKIDQELWEDPDMEDPLVIPPSTLVLVHLTFPTIDFKRRYYLTYVPFSSSPVKRSCVIL